MQWKLRLSIVSLYNPFRKVRWERRKKNLKKKRGRPERRTEERDGGEGRKKGPRRKEGGCGCRRRFGGLQREGFVGPRVHGRRVLPIASQYRQI